jgi:hypothetical protein
MALRTLGTLPASDDVRAPEHRDSCSPKVLPGYGGVEEPARQVRKLIRVRHLIVSPRREVCTGTTRQTQRARDAYLFCVKDARQAFIGAPPYDPDLDVRCSAYADCAESAWVDVVERVPSGVRVWSLRVRPQRISR